MIECRISSCFSIILLVALGPMSSFAALGMSGGKGTVLSTTNGSPVPGATVTLECWKSKNFHGSEKIKEISTLTDQDGKYSFSTKSVLLCGYAFVSPKKEGYIDAASVDIRYSYSSYGKIPAKLHLSPANEERMQRLKYFVAMSQVLTTNARELYPYLFGQFASSMEVAKTELEIKFVQNSFCARLSSAYRELSEADRVMFKEIHAGFPAIPIDHERFVVPYCSMP